MVCQWMKRGAVTGLGLLLFAGLALLEENWRAKRDWVLYQNRQRAAGILLDWKSLVPATVRDEENFAATPLLAHLHEYRYTSSDTVRGAIEYADTNTQSRIRELFWWGECLGDTTAWQQCKRADLNSWWEEIRATDADQGRANPSMRSGLSDRLQGALAGQGKTTPEADLRFLIQQDHTALEELRMAARRPHAHFQTHFEEGDDALCPELTFLMRAGQAFETTSLLALRGGDVAGGFEDAMTCFALAKACCDHRLRVALLNLTLQPVWEGLAQRQWQDEHLAAFQSVCAEIDLVAESHRNLHRRRVLTLTTLDLARRDRTRVLPLEGDMRISHLEWLPEAWFYRVQLALCRLYDESCLPVFDQTKGRIDLKRASAATVALHEWRRHRSPYQYFASWMVPDLEECAESAARAQTTVHLAATACALERYYRATGAYPSNFDALVPAFMRSVPRDVIDNQPLRYRRTDDGRFALYSVALDGKDDGGFIQPTEGAGRRLGDWVWGYTVEAGRQP
jgi:hypothetical protein